MPWKSNDELPAQIKKAIPSKAAQSVFRKAANACFAAGGNDEKCIKTGYAAVKKSKSKSMEAIMETELADGCRNPDLPASAYAWVEDPDKKTTWHLPYKGMDGEVKCQCVRAAIAAIAGARTGTPMKGVPDSAKAKLRSAAKKCKIETELSATYPDFFKHAVELSIPISKELSYTETSDGDTVFHNVVLMAAGTWTDNHSKTATAYSGTELEKM